MAHQIETMFYLGKTPWHGLGKRLNEAPSVEDAIKQAGLSWRVLEQPIFLQGQTNAIATHKAIVRETDQSVLGVVGSRYKPLQNAEAFAFFNPLVETKLVSLETAGSLQDGKRIWVLARINDNSDLSIVGDDIVRKFILLSNSHDGTLAVRVGFTPVRVVCANTLAMAHFDGQSQLIRLKHSASVNQNLADLRDVINLANQSFEATADQYRKLASKQISRADLERYVKIVFGHDKTAEEDLSTRAKNQIADVISLFETGRGSDLQSAKGTVWGAYNAVTEMLTHNAGSDADKRYNSLWFGNNAVRNQLALTEALKLAA